MIIMIISVFKACQVDVLIMLLNKFYSEFAPVTRLKFPLFPGPHFIFFKPFVTSQKSPLTHNTTAYTGHVPNINAWVIVEYRKKLWENSK